MSKEGRKEKRTKKEEVNKRKERQNQGRFEGQEGSRNRTGIWVLRVGSISRASATLVKAPREITSTSPGYLWTKVNKMGKRVTNEMEDHEEEGGWGINEGRN